MVVVVTTVRARGVPLFFSKCATVGKITQRRPRRFNRAGSNRRMQVSSGSSSSGRPGGSLVLSGPRHVSVRHGCGGGLQS